MCVRVAIPVEISRLAVWNQTEFFNYIRFKNNNVKIIFFSRKKVTRVENNNNHYCHCICSKYISLGAFVVLSSL